MTEIRKNSGFPADSSRPPRRQRVPDLSLGFAPPQLQPAPAAAAWPAWTDRQRYTVADPDGRPAERGAR